MSRWMDEAQMSQNCSSTASPSYEVDASGQTFPGKGAPFFHQNSADPYAMQHVLVSFLNYLIDSINVSGFL